MSLWSIGIVLTGILISFVILFAGYCFLIMARWEDERQQFEETGIQPGDKVGGVAPERRSLRVVRQEDSDR